MTQHIMYLIQPDPKQALAPTSTSSLLADQKWTQGSPYYICLDGFRQRTDICLNLSFVIREIRNGWIQGLSWISSIRALLPPLASCSLLFLPSSSFFDVGWMLRRLLPRSVNDSCQQLQTYTLPTGQPQKGRTHLSNSFIKNVTKGWHDIKAMEILRIIKKLFSRPFCVK